jgi:hypothetical protein
MEEGTAAQYSKALRMQLADAGLQGAIQSDAFKLLVQYMTNEQADQQIMALILEQLKQGKVLSSTFMAWCVCSASIMLGGGAGMLVLDRCSSRTATTAPSSPDDALH